MRRSRERSSRARGLVRHALRRGADPYVGAVVVPGVAVIVAVVVSAPSLALDEIHLADLWPFALAGLLVPGASQLLFIIAVRDAGLLARRS
jgi:hypothetical protein